MLLAVFGVLHYFALLLFGVYVSAAFLNIKLNRRNIFILLGFSCAIMTVQCGGYVILGFDRMEKLYPVVTHIPVALLCTLFYKRQLQSSILAVLCSYLCCQISKWVMVLSEFLTGHSWLDYFVRIMALIVTFILIVNFMAPSVATIISKSRKSILIFGILPMIYYIFDYGVTVYTDLLYSGSIVVFEFLPLVLCISYWIFCVVYFKEYEEKLEARQHMHLMEIKRSQSEKEIEAIKRSEYTVSLLRHDMRHFLNNISSFISNNDMEKAKEYISEIISNTEKTALQKYSNNKIVNMILCSYENEMKDKNILLDRLIEIPDELPFSDVDLTSILSNGLENAIFAVSSLPIEERKIALHLRMNEDKFLLSIQNPYIGKIDMIDDVPISSRKDHGLGVQSIRYVTEKLKGNCRFVVKENVFILQVVL